MRGLAPVAPPGLIQEPHPELIQPVLHQIKANRRDINYVPAQLSFIIVYFGDIIIAKKFLISRSGEVGTIERYTINRI